MTAEYPRDPMPAGPPVPGTRPREREAASLMAFRSLRRMVDEMREQYGDLEGWGDAEDWPLTVRGRPTTDVELGPQAGDKL